MPVKKYWLVFKLTLEDYFVYRLNFLLWRFRSFVFFVTLIFFWQAVYSGRNTLFGYSQEQMLAYIIGVAVLRGVVLGSRTMDELPGTIKDGALTKFLLKPASVFSHLFSRDLAAKLLDIVFVVGEVFLVIRILHLDLYFPQKSTTLLAFLLIVFLAIILYFQLSLLISGLCFWLEETWATRWLLGIIFLEFMAGLFFPLDVLPQSLVRVINLTPFPYLIYFPIKIWNESFNSFQLSKVILIVIFWIGAVNLLVNRIWKKGLRIYSAHGG